MHRLSLVVIVVAVAACSKSKDEGHGEHVPAKPMMPDDTPIKPVLGPPPADAFRGNARVINLLLDGGKPVSVDVWGRRTFEWAPVQLAKNVAYGTATAWYGVPKGMATVVVPVGAGADAKEISALFAPGDADEQLSNLVAFDRIANAALLPAKPHGKNNAPELPPAGKGLVMLNAMQLIPHDATLTASIGGRSFFVGDGTGKCVHQRSEDKGFDRSVLGGTQPIEHDAAPGKATFTFHKWPAPKDQECSSPKVFEVTVDVVEGAGVLVLLHTRDGKTLEALQLPLWK